MNPTFSLLHATYRRPEKAVAAMRMWFERAERPESVEYIFAVNREDDATLEALRLLREKATYPEADADIIPQFKLVIGDFAGSAPAWDAAAKVSLGDLLIQGQDDVECPKLWDGCLLEWLEGANMDPYYWRRVPTIVAVKDGYRKDFLQCTAIMNRRRYEQQGYFLWPQFISVFSDDDFTIRGLADERDGKCMIVRTDLEFRHEHAYHNPTVPMDATYERENSSEAYALGSALFLQRNADLVARGFKTW